MMRRLTILLVLAMLVLFTPLALRMLSGAPISPGAESYIHLRNAELLAQGTLEDPVTGEPVPISPHCLLLAVMVLIGIPWALPQVIMLALLWSFFLLVKRTEHENVALISIAVFAISPTALLLGTGHDPRALAVLFGIAGLLVARRWLRVILLAVGVATSFPVGLAFAAYPILARTSWKTAVIDACIAAFVGGAWAVLAHSSLHHTGIFFELGTPGGISLFFVIVAGYGLLAVRRAPGPMILAGALVVLVVLFPVLIPLLVLFASVLIARAWDSLIDIEWDLDLLRQSFMILIVCAGMFLLITGVKERASATPGHEIADALVTIGTSHRDGDILAEPEYAPLIVYFAHRQPTLPRTTSSEQFILSFSSSPEETYSFLERTDTRFVIITPRIEETVGDDSGILLLLQTKRFVKLYGGEEGVIWYYIPRVNA